MPDFILEIGTEEMPARFQSELARVLAASLEARLHEATLAYDALKTYVTPRRLTAMAHGLAAVQPTGEELVTGPPRKVAFDASGQPTKAAIGFAKTQGVALEDAFIHTTDKGEYLAVNKKTGGAQASALLPQLLGEVIASLPFPKRMRWGAGEFTFGRPVRWLLALLGAEVLHFSLEGMQSGAVTYGHRVHGFGPWEVPDAASYVDILAEKGKIVLDPEQRRVMIVEQGDKLAQQAGGAVVWKESLLEEVTGLVEYPRPVLGNFEPGFLELPREVLLTSMESHQKSFGVEDAQGKLLPHFLSTLNLDSKDVALVRKGWERVLKARLEDARFFWKTDLAQSLDQWLDKLESVIFLGPLGSMADKARRIQSLSGDLAERIAPELTENVRRAGLLAKTDLVTEMVGEFADLQGVMGGIYARKMGENEDVATAVYEHYLPSGHDSPVPESLVGALVSMADKADTLAGCFGLKMLPTGANDPYALRRCALGICRTIMEKGLRLRLDVLLRQAVSGYGEREWKLTPEENYAALHDFFVQRLKAYFTAQGYSTLAVEAAVGAGIDDIWGLKARLEALEAFSKEDDFELAVLTFKRAGNIIRKQGQEAGQELTGAFSEAQLLEPQEKELARQIEAMAPRFENLWQQDAYGELMGLLRVLRPFVDAFFDHVMVMCDDPALRLNRLNLLQALVSRLGRLADFSALQV